MTFKESTLELLQAILIFHREFCEHHDRYPTLHELSTGLNISYHTACRYSRTFWLKFKKNGMPRRWDKSEYSKEDIEQIKGFLSSTDYDYFTKNTLRPIPQAKITSKKRR